MPHLSVNELWDQYRLKEAKAPSEPPHVEHFCDNEKDADACVDLILKGLKRATTSALASYRETDEPLPEPGKVLVVTNWAGEAKAIICTHTVTVCRMGDVPAAFAALEGEGDGTLIWWRTAHRAFWERTVAGHVIDDNFPVVCEEFDLITTV